MDVFYVTGNVYPEVEATLPQYPHRSPRIVFRNAGGGRFVDVTASSGPGVTTPQSSRGAAFGDIDQDGDVDALVMNMNAPPSLLRNDSRSGHHWLTVRLEGTRSNRQGIGATVLRHERRTHAGARRAQPDQLLLGRRSATVVRARRRDGGRSDRSALAVPAASTCERRRGRSRRHHPRAREVGSSTPARTQRTAESRSTSSSIDFGIRTRSCRSKKTAFRSKEPNAPSSSTKSSDIAPKNRLTVTETSSYHPRIHVMPASHVRRRRDACRRWPRVRGRSSTPRRPEGTSHDVSCSARSAIDGPSSPAASACSAVWHRRARVSSSAPAGAAAQAVYGSLSGTVTDSSGGALPGATVTITSLERNVVDTVVANESGNYAKDRLLPGAYEVKAELTGFKTAVVPTRHGQRRHADAGQLQARSRRGDRGGDGERRRAAAQDGPRRRGDALRRQGADRAAGARSQLHQVHPADAGRAADGLAARGVARTRRGRRRRRSTASTSAAPAISSTAPRTATRSSASSSSTRTLESIGESKVTSQNYDAEFGQATAGVVSVQTKSGTNELHGSAFEFFQNAALQARNPFRQARVDPLTGKFIPGYQEEPVRRIGRAARSVQNKWFFFGDYQGTRQNQGGSRLLVGADGAGARGQLQRVRPGHLRPGSPARRSRTRRIPADAPVAAGARHPRPDSAAERAGHARTARATTTRRRASRPSRRTRSTPASTAGCPTR